MAVNPMQKKARNSFLLGMLVTFIICAIIGIMVYILIVLPENKEKSERGQVKTVYVLNRDVKSGEEITVITKANNWMFIQTDDIAGWIVKDETVGKNLENTETNKEGTENIENEETKTNNNDEEEENASDEINIVPSFILYETKSSGAFSKIFPLVLYFTPNSSIIKSSVQSSQYLGISIPHQSFKTQ